MRARIIVNCPGLCELLLHRNNIITLESTSNCEARIYLRFIYMYVRQPTASSGTQSPGQLVLVSIDIVSLLYDLGVNSPMVKL